MQHQRHLHQHPGPAKREAGRPQIYVQVKFDPLEASIMLLRALVLALAAAAPLPPVSAMEATGAVASLGGSSPSKVRFPSGTKAQLWSTGTTFTQSTLCTAMNPQHTAEADAIRLYV